jgi:hypothetical protein
MEQPKRAGSPLAHKRVSVPKKEWASGGPQQQTAMQRLGPDPSAVAVEGVQRNAAEGQARNAARDAAAAVERDSRMSLRRVAALVALIAIGLSPAGGWGTPLSGGLAGPVAGPVAGPFALHLASGGAGGLPAVLKACRKQAAAKPFLKMAAKGRAGALWPVGRVQEFWRWAFPAEGLGVAGHRATWPEGAVLESWTPFGAGVSIVLDVVPTHDKGAGKAGEGLGHISDTEVAKHFRIPR